MFFLTRASEKVPQVPPPTLSAEPFTDKVEVGALVLIPSSPVFVILHRSAKFVTSVSPEPPAITKSCDSPTSPSR